MPLKSILPEGLTLLWHDKDRNWVSLTPKEEAHKETVHGHGEWTIQDLVCWSQETVHSVSRGDHEKRNMTLWLAQSGCTRQGPDDLLALGDIRDQCILSPFERTVQIDTCGCPIEDWDGNIPRYVNLLPAQQLPRLQRLPGLQDYRRARVLCITSANDACLYDNFTWPEVLQHLRMLPYVPEQKPCEIVTLCDDVTCLQDHIFANVVRRNANASNVMHWILDRLWLDHRTMKIEYSRYGREMPRRLKDVDLAVEFAVEPVVAEDRVRVIVGHSHGEPAAASVWRLQRGPGSAAYDSAAYDEVYALQIYRSATGECCYQSPYQLDYSYIAVDNVAAVREFDYDHFMAHGWPEMGLWATQTLGHAHEQRLYIGFYGENGGVQWPTTAAGWSTTGGAATGVTAYDNSDDDDETPILPSEVALADQEPGAIRLHVKTGRARVHVWFKPIDNHSRVLRWEERRPPSHVFSKYIPYLANVASAEHLRDKLLRYCDKRRALPIPDPHDCVVVPDRGMWRQRGPCFDPKEIQLWAYETELEGLVSAAIEAEVHLPGVVLHHGNELLGNAIQDVMYYRHPDGRVSPAHKGDFDYLVYFGGEQGAVAFLLRANGKQYRSGQSMFWWRQGISHVNSTMHPVMFVFGPQGDCVVVHPREYGDMMLSDVTDFFKTCVGLVRCVPAIVRRKVTRDQLEAPAIKWGPTSTALPWNVCRDDDEEEEPVPKQRRRSVRVAAATQARLPPPHVGARVGARGGARVGTTVYPQAPYQQPQAPPQALPQVHPQMLPPIYHQQHLTHQQMAPTYQHQQAQEVPPSFQLQAHAQMEHAHQDPYETSDYVRSDLQASIAVHPEENELSQQSPAMDDSAPLTDEDVASLGLLVFGPESTHKSERELGFSLLDDIRKLKTEAEIGRVIQAFLPVVQDKMNHSPVTLKAILLSLISSVHCETWDKVIKKYVGSQERAKELSSEDLVEMYKDGPEDTPRALATVVGTLAHKVASAEEVNKPHVDVLAALRDKIERDYTQALQSGAPAWMSIRQEMRYAKQVAGVLLSSMSIPTLACDQVLRDTKKRLSTVSSDGRSTLSPVELHLMLVQLHTGTIGQLMPVSLRGPTSSLATAMHETRAIMRTRSIAMISGPTGAGKTTTFNLLEVWPSGILAWCNTVSAPNEEERGCNRKGWSALYNVLAEYKVVDKPDGDKSFGRSLLVRTLCKASSVVASNVRELVATAREQMMPSVEEADKLLKTGKLKASNFNPMSMGEVLASLSPSNAGVSSTKFNTFYGLTTDEDSFTLDPEIRREFDLHRDKTLSTLIISVKLQGESTPDGPSNGDAPKSKVVVVQHEDPRVLALLLYLFSDVDVSHIDCTDWDSELRKMWKSLRRRASGVQIDWARVEKPSGLDHVLDTAGCDDKDQDKNAVFESARSEYETVALVIGAKDQLRSATLFKDPVLLLNAGKDMRTHPFYSLCAEVPRLQAPPSSGGVIVLRHAQVVLAYEAVRTGQPAFFVDYPSRFAQLCAYSSKMSIEQLSLGEVVLSKLLSSTVEPLYRLEDATRGILQASEYVRGREAMIPQQFNDVVRSSNLGVFAENVFASTGGTKKAGADEAPEEELCVPFLRTVMKNGEPHKQRLPFPGVKDRVSSFRVKVEALAQRVVGAVVESDHIGHQQNGDQNLGQNEDSMDVDGALSTPGVPLCIQQLIVKVRQQATAAGVAHSVLLLPSTPQKTRRAETSGGESANERDQLDALIHELVCSIMEDYTSYGFIDDMYQCLRDGAIEATRDAARWLLLALQADEKLRVDESDIDKLIPCFDQLEEVERLGAYACTFKTTDPKYEMHRQLLRGVAVIMWKAVADMVQVLGGFQEACSIDKISVVRLIHKILTDWLSCYRWGDADFMDNARGADYDHVLHAKLKHALKNDLTRLKAKWLRQHINLRELPAHMVRGYETWEDTLVFERANDFAECCAEIARKFKTAVHEELGKMTHPTDACDRFSTLLDCLLPTAVLRNFPAAASASAAAPSTAQKSDPIVWGTKRWYDDGQVLLPQLLQEVCDAGKADEVDEQMYKLLITRRHAKDPITVADILMNFLAMMDGVSVWPHYGVPDGGWAAIHEDYDLTIQSFAAQDEGSRGDEILNYEAFRAALLKRHAGAHDPSDNNDDIAHVKIPTYEQWSAWISEDLVGESLKDEHRQIVERAARFARDAANMDPNNLAARILLMASATVSGDRGTRGMDVQVLTCIDGEDKSYYFPSSRAIRPPAAVIEQLRGDKRYSQEFISQFMNRTKILPTNASNLKLLVDVRTPSTPSIRVTKSDPHLRKIRLIYPTADNVIWQSEAPTTAVGGGGMRGASSATPSPAFKKRRSERLNAIENDNNDDIMTREARETRKEVQKKMDVALFYVPMPTVVRRQSSGSRF